MNEHLRQAIMLEKRCYQMFQAMGWDMTHTMETKLPGGTLFRPDTLSCDNQIVGCVEVKTNYNDYRMSKRK